MSHPGTVKVDENWAAYVWYFILSAGTIMVCIMVCLARDDIRYALSTNPRVQVELTQPINQRRNSISTN